MEVFAWLLGHTEPAHPRSLSALQSLSEAEPSSQGCTHTGMIHSGFSWVGENKRRARKSNSHLPADRVLRRTKAGRCLRGMSSAPELWELPPAGAAEMGSPHYGIPNPRGIHSSYILLQVNAAQHTQALDKHQCRRLPGMLQNPCFLLQNTHPKALLPHRQQWQQQPAVLSCCSTTNCCALRIGDCRNTRESRHRLWIYKWYKPSRCGYNN